MHGRASEVLQGRQEVLAEAAARACRRDERQAVPASHDTVGFVNVERLRRLLDEWRLAKASTEPLCENSEMPRMHGWLHRGERALGSYHMVCII